MNEGHFENNVSCIYKEATTNNGNRIPIPPWGSRSGDQESVEYPFIAFTLKSTLTLRGNICLGPIYKFNRSVQKLFVFDKMIEKKTKQT